MAEMEPHIIDQTYGRIDDYEGAIRAMASQVRHSGQAAFEYHHYSAFKIVITRHIAGAYALTVGYTNQPATTVIWWAGGDPPDLRARSLGLSRGHDTDTIASLLRSLGYELTGERLATASAPRQPAVPDTRKEPS